MGIVILAVWGSLKQKNLIGIAIFAVWGFFSKSYLGDEMIPKRVYGSYTSRGIIVEGI